MRYININKILMRSINILQNKHNAMKNVGYIKHIHGTQSVVSSVYYKIKRPNNGIFVGWKVCQNILDAAPPTPISTTTV